MKQAGVAAAAFTIVPRFVLGGAGYRAPSDKLYVAGIGAGGKGQSDIANFRRVERPRLPTSATSTIVVRLSP